MAPTNIGLTLNFVDQNNNRNLMSYKMKLSTKAVVGLRFNWAERYELEVTPTSAPTSPHFFCSDSTNPTSPSRSIVGSHLDPLSQNVGNREREPWHIGNNH